MNIIDDILKDNRVEVRIAPVDHQGRAVGALKIVEGRLEERKGDALLVTGIHAEWSSDEIWSPTITLKIWGYSKLTRMRLFVTEHEIRHSSTSEEVPELIVFGEF